MTVSPLWITVAYFIKEFICRPVDAEDSSAELFESHSLMLSHSRETGWKVNSSVTAYDFNVLGLSLNWPSALKLWIKSRHANRCTSWNRLFCDLWFRKLARKYQGMTSLPLSTTLTSDRSTLCWQPKSSAVVRRESHSEGGTQPYIDTPVALIRRAGWGNDGIANMSQRDIINMLGWSLLQNRTVLMWPGSSSYGGKTKSKRKWLQLKTYNKHNYPMYTHLLGCTPDVYNLSLFFTTCTLKWACAHRFAHVSITVWIF